jgi:hypothetical protein
MLRFGSLLVGTMLLLPSAALADDEPRAAPPPYEGEPATAVPPPRAAPPVYLEDPAPKAAPLGHRGFQFALRTGLSFPFGSAAVQTFSSSALNKFVGPQLPITFDIGGKPNKHLFLGGYVGFGFGFVKGGFAQQCDRVSSDCTAMSTRFGAQIHYAILPNDWVNPWVGYGLGFSWLSAGDDGYSVSLRGFEFAHLMAGVDFRISRIIGLGLFVDGTLGTYSSSKIDTPTTRSNEDITNEIYHWLTIGPRLVVMP